MDKKFIFNIQKKIYKKIHPDITFLIDLNNKESKIRNGFIKISKTYKNKIVLIKGSRSLIEIQNEINKKTLKILNARF